MDKQARRYLKMSGEEFIKKWEAGEFDEEFEALLTLGYIPESPGKGPGLLLAHSGTQTPANWVSISGL